MLREWSQKILICISSSIFILLTSQNMGKYKVFNFPTSILIFYLVILNCKYVNQFNWIAPLLHFTSRINVLDCFGWHYFTLTNIRYYLNRIESNYLFCTQKSCTALLTERHLASPFPSQFSQELWISQPRWLPITDGPTNNSVFKQNKKHCF